MLFLVKVLFFKISAQLHDVFQVSVLLTGEFGKLLRTADKDTEAVLAHELLVFIGIGNLLHSVIENIDYFGRSALRDGKAPPRSGRPVDAAFFECRNIREGGVPYVGHNGQGPYFPGRNLEAASGRLQEMTST